ncbi:hypothetical protein L6164_026309 [Bauhinia variegata]|uniref:Uncharacterized protein n=1 Tax=Bauhinia variegata TaxID=167791 RepID=A0ACB9LPB5_BAUVA|nr:hypothetical protein L6164_026309 [Bauhinia variegata]
MEDVVYDIYGNIINGGGLGHCPIEHMDVAEESPTLEPEENAVETEVVAEDEQNEAENEPVEEGEPHTTELPDGYYEVEAIRAMRVWKGRKQYLIKWLGWPEETNTWEPIRHLTLVKDMIDDFEKRKQRKQKRRPALHSTSSRTTKRRNCSSIRRFIKEPPVCNVANSHPAVEPVEARESNVVDSQRITNIPADERVEANVSDTVDSERITNIPIPAVEQEEIVASGNAGNNDHNNQVGEVIDNHYIVRIVKPDSYRPPQSDTDDPTLRFLALRSDDALVMVDNHFLKENNPQLLFNYYEENINWQSRLSRHRG